MSKEIKHLAAIAVAQLYRLAPEINFQLFNPDQLSGLLKFDIRRQPITNLCSAKALLYQRWLADGGLERECGAIEENNLQVICWHEPSYPNILRTIACPPPVIFIKGQLSPDYATTIAVVGSRRASYYGQGVIRCLIPTLAKSGLTIMSGLALGIDTAAHWSAINSHGKTLAVLGSGLANIYPPQNKSLADKIVASGGALISEFPPLTAPFAKNFPQRNRLISGLSHSVLVVEAAKRSGALITARFALEQGRDLLAIPGSIFSPLSEGTNSLISQGAYPITTAADIIEHFTS